MQQEAKIFKGWLLHDIQGKFLSNLVLFLVPWAKWAITRYCIYYWFANGYDPDYKENFFGLSEKLDFKGKLMEIAMKTLFMLVYLNFLRAAYGDPGFVHLMKFKMPENVLPDKYEKNCLRCFNRWKPPRAHHCRICTRCVLRMDHHCEWIGNCVGAKNQKFFISFLFYTVLYALLGLGICLMNLILWLMQYGTKTKGPTQNGWATFNKILLAISSIFFIFFAFDFLWEQMEAVLTNQTTVETYKHMAGRPGTFWEKMDKVFGSNRWSWLLPVAPKLKLNALELLYYETEIEKNVFKEDELKNLPIYNNYAVK